MTLDHLFECKIFMSVKRATKFLDPIKEMETGKLLDTLESTLPHVFIFVEATSYERQCLWREFSPISKWEDSGRWLGKYVGEHNTFITFHFAHINGNLVAFYEPTSSIVNWNDVESFIRSFGIRKIRASNYYPSDSQQVATNTKKDTQETDPFRQCPGCRSSLPASSWVERSKNYYTCPACGY